MVTISFKPLPSLDQRDSQRRYSLVDPSGLRMMITWFTEINHYITKLQLVIVLNTLFLVLLVFNMYHVPTK